MSSLVKKRELDSTNKLSTISFVPKTTPQPYDKNGVYGTYSNDRFYLTWIPYRDSNSSIYFEYIANLDGDEPDNDIWIAFAFSNDQFMVKFIHFYSY